MLAGIEWLVEAQGCAVDRLQSLIRLQSVCGEIVRELDLNVVGEPLWHQFPGPGGVTGLYLLSESHLACHTYPEVGLATFNLYCCRERPNWNWRERLGDALRAKSVCVRSVPRGEMIDPLRNEEREENSRSGIPFPRAGVLGISQ
ncbi:MAG: S-adenosylmethionine decarboxylase [Planctomycetota bacterium]|nr:S-adenosylmethionine decarboxylase [Planctomycetota bacterium]